MGYPLFFLVKFFVLKNYLIYYCKVLQIRAKLSYSAETFIFSAYFESLNLAEKWSKSHGLTPLLFGQIFRPQKLSQILL